MTLVGRMQGLLALGVIAIAALFSWPQATQFGWPVALLLVSPAIAFGFVAIVFYERYRDRRTGVLLGLTSVLWAVTELGLQSRHPLLRDIGAMGLDLPFGPMVFAIVGLPGARLRTRLARFVVVATLVADFAVDPIQTLVSSPCRDCATRRVLYADWPAVRAVVGPLAIALSIGFGVGLAAFYVQRWRQESAAARRLFGPVFVMSAVTSIVYAVGGVNGDSSYIPSLRFGAHSFQDAMAVLTSTLMVATALSFFVGMRRANQGARRVGALLPELFLAAESDLGRMLGDAVGDPSLTLDLSPAESAPPAPGGRALTNVEVDGRVVARMNHDAALLEQPALLDAARNALAALFGERLRTGDAELARQVRELRRAFAAYVDPALADEIAEGRQAADSTEADVTLLFLDVRGFTAYSDGRDPGEVVARLNALWERVVPVITRHYGRANKFVGDGLLAVFGLDDPARNHADDAVAAARELAALLTAGESALSFGIGLNTGLVIVGSVGGGGRVDFTVIGDAVNTASRVESVTRETGDAVLLSEATRARLSRVDGVLQRGLFELKGKAEPAKLYALSAASSA